MNIQQIINALQQNRVVAYPTEAVFGLGCNPYCIGAIEHLLTLKQRSKEKGFILIAPSLAFFADFVDFSQLSAEEKARLATISSRAITWTVPAKSNVSPYIRGNFSHLAIRLCQHPDVVTLCEAVGYPLISTSANLSGQTPAKTAQEVRQQFGGDFPVLDGNVGGAVKPSEIRQLVDNRILRQGE